MKNIPSFKIYEMYKIPANEIHDKRNKLSVVSLTSQSNKTQNSISHSRYINIPMAFDLEVAFPRKKFPRNFVRKILYVRLLPTCSQAPPSNIKSIYM
jgi:hypothetical protein